MPSEGVSGYEWSSVLTRLLPGSPAPLLALSSTSSIHMCIYANRILYSFCRFRRWNFGALQGCGKWGTWPPRTPSTLHHRGFSKQNLFRDHCALGSSSSMAKGIRSGERSRPLE